MSSIVFQPLLHDPLGWKSSNSTYTDHFKWRRYRTKSKDKKISSYSQQYQRQQQQQQQLHGCLPAANREETIRRVSELKKDEENRTPSGSCRSAKPKTPSTVIDEPPVLIVEYKRRPVSTSNLDVSSGSRASQRLATGVEEKRRPATSIDTQRHEKEEKRPIDPDNDNSRHWMTYPNPKTPQYLIDIKQRLGQLKVSSTLARPVSASSPLASNVAVQQQQEEQQPHLDERPSSASQHQQPAALERHFLSYAPVETPADLRAARYRIRKERYNPSLDNYPPRPQTCPARSDDVKTSQDYDDEQLPLPSPPKDEAWTADEESKIPEDECSSVLVQMVDVDGLPSEYVDALEIAAEAQDAYRRSMTSIGERRPDNPVYRLSATTPDINGNSLVAYRNQQQQSAATATATSMNNHPLRQVARTSSNDFGVWVRNATDRERASAMKILQEVLHQPMMDYDTPTKHQAIFKQPPAPPPIRASSATRKLGRTRTQHQFPCEICEKLLIKRHVWDLSRIQCPHSIVIT